jgi:hypothetical protein
MWRGVLMTILASSLLAGCEIFDFGADPEPTAVPPPPEIVAEPAEAPPPPVAKPPAPLPERKPSLPTQTASVDPKQLLGLGFSETEALLGKPTERVDRPPAQVWIYDAETCVVNIFFYADMSTREYRALTYEVKHDTAGEPNERCLARLMRQASS